MSEPVGSVTFGEGRIVATLDDEGGWIVVAGGAQIHSLAHSLAVTYERSYNGPQDGYHGQLILADLAARTGGTMEFIEPPMPDPGDIP